MRAYADWAPTGFDARGAFLDDRDEWMVVPVMRTRDSGPLAESNFASAWASIQQADAGEDCETHRFGHWGPGWFEIILVRPGSACARAAAEIESGLEVYPVLDDEDYSRRELEAAEETWTQCYSLRERVELIREHNRYATHYPISIFAARHPWIPRGDTGFIFDRCRPEE